VSADDVPKVETIPNLDDADATFVDCEDDHAAVVEGEGENDGDYDVAPCHTPQYGRQQHCCDDDVVVVVEVVVHIP
jgi:hypothetical protein